MVDWEWFQDPNTFRVFIYLLMTANHEERKWQGKTILAGQRITSYQHLANDIGMGVQSVRTAINKLKSTGELTYHSTTKYSLLTISKWDEYQNTNTPTNKRATNEQQTTNKQLTTNKNDKNVENDNNDKKQELSFTVSKLGEFENVSLSEEEYEKLCTALGKPNTDSLVAELSSYIASSGKRYKSHYATLQGWARRKMQEHSQQITKKGKGLIV